MNQANPPGEPAQWQVGIDGQQSGPFPLDHLKRLIAEGRIPPQALVWKPGMTEWKPWAQVPELSAGGGQTIPERPRAAAPDAQQGPSALGDFLSFRRMVTPLIVQIIFWIGVALCALAGLVSLVSGGMGGGLGLMISGLITLVVGPLVVRLYCELVIIVFRMYETLNDIRDQGLAGSASRPPEKAASLSR